MSVEDGLSNYINADFITGSQKRAETRTIYGQNLRQIGLDTHTLPDVTMTY